MRDLRLVQHVHGRRFPRWQQVRHISRVFNTWERWCFRGAFVLFLFGSGWFVTTVLAEHRLAVPAIGGRYIEAVVGSPQLVNPIFSTVNDVDTDLVKLIFSGLMRYDKDQHLVPDLAERYELSEDKKTYTFYLRRDVLWHDGEPFTARDVVFTMETIQNPLVNSPLFAGFQGVRTEMVDDYTVRLTLSEAYRPFLSSLASLGIIPEHAWFDVPPERMYLHKKNLQPVGTGPFQFKKLTKDDSGFIYSYELARNNRYYIHPPYIEEMVFQFFSDYDAPGGEGSPIQSLREQRVLGLHFVPHDLRDKVERKHIFLHTLQLPQYTALFFNLDSAVVKDKDTRAALEQAIDKQLIVREVLHHAGTVIQSPILPGFPGYKADAEKPRYSLEEANTLLDKTWQRIPGAEYREVRRQELLKSLSTSTTDVVTSTLATSTIEEVESRLAEELQAAQSFYRRTKDGTVLDLKIVTADTPEYRQAAQLIAGFWQEAGVKTTIQYVQPRDIGRLALKERSYDVLLYGFIIGNDPDQYPFWHSSQVDFPGLNVSRYVNRTVDGMLEKARETTDDAEMTKLYGQFQDAIVADRPAIFLYSPNYTYATADRVQGLNVTRISHPSDRFADVIEWYMKTKGDWRWRVGS